MTRFALKPYFVDLALAQSALQKYAATARGLAWSLPAKRELYEIAKTAFASDVDEEAKRNAFGKIYDNLRRYWQVFRPMAAGTYWSCSELHSELLKCTTTSRQGAITLISDFREPTVRQAVKSHLLALRGIKPGKWYPAMPVAKFSHFFNPSLFPIYDTEVIYKKVLKGAFSSDWNAFSIRLPEDFFASKDGISDAFNWIAWGSDMIRSSEPTLMEYFADWFVDRTGGPGENLGDLKSELRTYYGTAFEFIAIGASYLNS